MNMKSITAFALASLAFAGVACSQASDTDAAGVQTVSAENTTGTLNLSLPSPTSDTDASTGSFNLNLGGNTSESRLIGSGALGGGDFGGDPAFNLDLDLSEETAALDGLPAADAGAADDDIIRLEPKK
ncbi:MAG: hypothetical protein KKC43_08880 [Alphaproteobacteria bacterium]|nr:hypothetical protein [Alphaproteobacteria bacterium]